MKKTRGHAGDTYVATRNTQHLRPLAMHRSPRIPSGRRSKRGWFGDKQSRFDPRQERQMGINPIDVSENAFAG